MAPKGLGSAVYLAHMFLSQVLGDGERELTPLPETVMTQFFWPAWMGPRARSMPLIFSP